jgi:hypothetical protein
VINQYKMAKHFKLEIEENQFSQESTKAQLSGVLSGRIFLLHTHSSMNLS